MQIKLNTFANLKDIIGTKELFLDLPDGSSLGELLNTLQNRYGEPFERQIKDKITREIVPFLILVNEDTYRSTTDLATPLKDGDCVTIMIPFDGG